MTFGPKTIWWLNLAMVMLVALALNVDWRAMLGVTWGPFVYGGLAAWVMVLNFVANGVKPPVPPAK